MSAAVTSQAGPEEAWVSEPERMDAAIETAAAAVFRLQRPDGSWCDTVPSAAIATGSAVIALMLADPHGSRSLIDAGARWLCAAQSADGGWGEAPGAPATIYATATAVAALQFADREDCAQALWRGFDRFDGMGGLAALGDPAHGALGLVCQQYLAMAGISDDRAVVRIPIELSLFPRSLRRRFCLSLPALMAWGLMQSRQPGAGPVRRLVNRLAAPRALAFLAGLARFEGDGGGFEESPLMTSIVCVGLVRAGLGPDIVEHCVKYLRGTVRPDGSWPVVRDLEFTVSALLTVGLQEVGLGDDTRLARTEQWIRDRQMTRRFGPTGCPAGGWQRSQPSGWPGGADTADGVAALAGFSCEGGRNVLGNIMTGDDNLRRGVRWLLDMQNGDGSWSQFRHSPRPPVDAACSVITAHAVMALQSATGMTATGRPPARAVAWIGRAQRPDGAVAAAWYTGLTAGTGSCLTALGRLGPADGPVALRLTDWLVGHQNPDGGWGDGAGGGSTVEETSWALLGLADSALPADHPALARGARWLVDTQGPDGLWRPSLVGMYMRNLLFASDHFANGYALQALGRVRRRTQTQTGD
jgi:squalene-hopene/tetraprenyl-beta-curcumene cyclase